MGLQYIFDLGNWTEKMTLRRMENAGIDVFQQQRDFEDKAHLITGHVDTFCREVKLVFPVEIKSMNEHIWRSIDEASDMMNHKKAHVRKYPGQLMLYLYMSEYEKGCFILVNKQNSHMKEIWIELDYEYVEHLLQKARSINEHIAAGTLPDRCKYDPDLCDRCDFSHICLPPVDNREGLLIEYEPEIIKKLDEREACAMAGKKYKKLDEEVKDYLKKRESDYIQMGDWFIQKKTASNGSVRIKIARLSEQETI
jgi:hypothetical protein